MDRYFELLYYSPCLFCLIYRLPQQVVDQLVTLSSPGVVHRLHPKYLNPASLSTESLSTNSGVFDYQLHGRDYIQVGGGEKPDDRKAIQSP